MRTGYFVLILLAAITFFSCTSREKTVYAHVAADCNMQETIEVLSKRMRSLHKRNKVEMLDNGKIAIRLHNEKDTSSVPYLLTTGGNVYVAETYNNAEIYPLMLKVNELLGKRKKAEDATNTVVVEEDKEQESDVLSDYQSILELSGDSNEDEATKELRELREQFQKKNPFFALVMINDYHSGPCAVRAKGTDTAEINTILKNPDIRRLFPTNLIFAWTFKPLLSETNTNTDIYELILIKDTKLQFELNDITVNKISQEKGYNGCSEAYIELHKEYAEHWARMTRDNIDNSLAIMLDGKVLSYPRVASEITGGRLTISGSFTKEEINEFIAFVKGGELNCSVVLEEPDKR